MGECENFYNMIMGFAPYEFQKKVWEKFWSKSFPQSFPLIIKAPTGSGKTEAVVMPFLYQFYNSSFNIAPRLIYVLPMRVLVNNIKERIENIAKKVNSNLIVKVQHGDAPDSPFFMADIVVTTLDQFIYGFARSSNQIERHLDLPAGAIASSIVVFDEAHMYRSGFTFSMMRAILEILYESNIPFVVMTATMPESLKNDLFKLIKINNEHEVSFSNRRIGGNLKVCLKKYSNLGEEICNIIEDEIKKGKKKFLVILNRVDTAQKVYDKVKDKLKIDSILLLHSRFTINDRKDKEYKALRFLPHKNRGKIECEDGVAVVVSTQVVEAGIDFSSEVLITELAPADALIQRMGRCARYTGEGEGEVYILYPNKTSNSNNLPYRNEDMETTYRYLEEHLNNSSYQINLDFRDFNCVCEFVNKLNYRCDDVEASDSLIDLYDCTLFADTKPSNIQVRNSKPIYLVISEREDKESVKRALEGNNIIEVDIKVGWKMKRLRLIKKVINFKEGGEIDIWRVGEINPFGFYVVGSDSYDAEKGLIIREDSSGESTLEEEGEDYVE